MTFTTKLVIQDQIETLEHNIAELNNEINSKQKEIDSFEYEVSESDFDEFLDDVEESVIIAGMTFYPSDILKSCDPVAYRCAKADYESNYDLDDVEEYNDLKQELEDLEGKLESELDELESELEELESLESDDEDNFVVEYLENGAVQYMYLYADNEDHAIEQFNDFFKDYKGDVKLVHCGYIVG